MLYANSAISYVFLDGCCERARALRGDHIYDYVVCVCAATYIQQQPGSKQLHAVRQTCTLLLLLLIHRLARTTFPRACPSREPRTSALAYTTNNRARRLRILKHTTRKKNATSQAACAAKTRRTLRLATRLRAVMIFVNLTQHLVVEQIHYGIDKDL